MELKFSIDFGPNMYYINLADRVLSLYNTILEIYLHHQKCIHPFIISLNKVQIHTIKIFSKADEFKGNYFISYKNTSLKKSKYYLKNMNVQSKYLHILSINKYDLRTCAC